MENNMSGYQVLDKSGKVIYSSGRGSVCDESCRRCVFHATATGGVIVCDYLLVMGRRRGCEAGKNCIRRINGKKAPSLDSRLYRLPPNPERETGIPAAALRAPSSGDGMAAAAGTGKPRTADSRREDHPPQPAEGAGSRTEMRKKPAKTPAEETPAERERRLAKERERYARNKDKMHAKQKAQREKRTPEQRQRKTEYMRQWREANRERVNAYQRERRSQETPEQKQRRCETTKQWVIENREKVNAAQQAYRSRKKAEKEEASDR